MAREDAVATLLRADATLAGILTGGIYTSGQVGRVGISRETTPAAFDANGWLKPCALVKQRGNVPDGMVRDSAPVVVSAAQVVEIWLYQDSGYSTLDSAMTRILTLLEGTTVDSGAFPAQLSNVIDRQRDEGALAGCSLARMDFVVFSIIEGA